MFEYYITYLAHDTTQQTHNHDFLNATYIPIPQHVIRLKVNCPIMMMRNHAAEGLCIGTRTVVKEFGK